MSPVTDPSTLDLTPVGSGDVEPVLDPEIETVKFEHMTLEERSRVISDFHKEHPSLAQDLLPTMLKPDPDPLLN
jgi:hypothetical protein